MTFSIAGRCARTGMLGAIVTTSSISVGSRCAWAEAGVGAVLTQHRTDPRLGPKILALLKRGTSPQAAIRELQESEPNLGWRQLAVVAADGSGAAFGGDRISSTRKERIGSNCAAAGNILRTPDVVDAMVESFEASEEQPLAERLMCAIEAGQASGGEWKQLKSAALLVVHRESFPFVDLRVDLHAQPLVELRFLWELYQPQADAYVVRAVEPERAPGPA
ncbi:MAG: DUF1028 domain-containing protein [Alphaproteobacteria bacterium]|nr:DUF1028 domain-containing protein [Alphaproteobacteria bacterium]MBV8409298.1 DUF1028 domain-containing protein [Alphaproteobacteria bacterium]